MVTPNILKVIESLMQGQQINVDYLIEKMDPEGNKNISDVSYASSLSTIVDKYGSLGQVFAQLNPLYASASKQQKKFLTASDEPSIIKRGKINSLVATLETILDDFAIFGFMQKEEIKDSFAEWYDKNGDYKDLVDIIIWRLYEKHGSFEQVFGHIAEYNNTLTSEYKYKRKNKVILDLLKKIDKDYIDIEKYVNNNRRLFIYYYLMIVNYPNMFLSPTLPQKTKSQVFKIVAAIIHPLKKTKSEENDFGKQVSNLAADYVFKASTLLGRLDENEIKLCKELFDTPEWKEAYNLVILEIMEKRKTREEFDKKCPVPSFLQTSGKKVSSSNPNSSRIKQYKEEFDTLIKQQGDTVLSYDTILNFIFHEEEDNIRKILDYLFGINGLPKLKTPSNVNSLLFSIKCEHFDYNISSSLTRKCNDFYLPLLNILKEKNETATPIIEQIYQRMEELRNLQFKPETFLEKPEDILFDTAISVFSEWKLKNKISGDAINVDDIKAAFFIENADAIRSKISGSYRAGNDFDISQEAVVNAFKCCFIETLIKEGYRYNPGDGLFEKIKTKDFHPVSASQNS